MPGYFSSIRPQSLAAGWASNNLTLTGTRFLSNTASLGNAGGAFVSGPATLQDAIFQGNRSQIAAGGGLYAFGSLTLTRTQFLNNTANDNGGGLYAASTLNLTRSSFVNNAAQHGGGLFHANGTADVINSLFARNTATVSGTALYLDSTGQVNLEYLTIGNPNFALGAAIEVAQGNVNLFDSIVANHAIGLRNDGGTVIQDYNLFHGNSVETLGTVLGGTHNATGDPKFVDAVHDNYHLGAGSAAIDQGTDLGIPIDFDGNPRPFGAGFDIGFDEYVLHLVYLPLVIR